MKLDSVFFVVGPTAAGKSDLAADVAASTNAEVVSADAFQVYCGLDLLTAKPGPDVIAKAPHHLLGCVPLEEEMNVERFRNLALAALQNIRDRKKPAIVAGGSGMYVKALTHGLSALPPADPEIRAGFARLTLEDLTFQLLQLDPKARDVFDLQNRRRVERALEICLLTQKPASAQRDEWESILEAKTPGVLVFRDRTDLYQRINLRVERMFEEGVIEEARAAEYVSATAEQMLGLRELRELIAGKIDRAQCIAAIQQATRRYAKRQLTWFRGQSNFEALNLSHLSHEQAVEWISERARRAFA